MKIQDGSLQGWEVYLADMDGNQLVEHQPQHFCKDGDTPAHSRVYVECNDNQEFQILVRRHSLRSRAPCQVKLRFDGRHSEQLAFTTSLESCMVKSMRVEENGKNCARQLKFAPLPRSEYGIKPSKDSLLQLGQIEVLLTRGGFTRSGRGHVTSISTGPVVDALHEEVVKQTKLSSLVQWGKRYEDPPKRLYTFTPTVSRRPHKIVLAYRTRTALEILGVVPEKPLRAPSKRIRTSPGTPEPNRPLAQGDANDEDDITPIEPPSKRKKIEVIDLTEEDTPGLTNLQILQKKVEDMKRRAQELAPNASASGSAPTVKTEKPEDK